MFDRTADHSRISGAFLLGMVLTALLMPVMILVGGAGFLGMRQAWQPAPAAAAPVVAAVPVELIVLKSGAIFAGRVAAEGSGVLRLEKALTIQITPPAKDAPADTTAKLGYKPLTETGDVKFTGEVKIPEANIDFREVLSAESPLYAAVMK